MLRKDRSSVEITVVEQDSFFILKLKGRLDTTTSSQLEAKLIDAINEASKHFILDCKDLEYISSAGLRVILMAAKKIKALKGQFFLTSLSSNVRQVFEISGFLNLIQTYPNVREALEATNAKEEE